jgi:hypothetical protein
MGLVSVEFNNGHGWRREARSVGEETDSGCSKGVVDEG